MLINKQTGQIIKYSSRYLSGGKVEIELFDNGIDFENMIVLKTDSLQVLRNIEPDKPLTLVDLENYSIIETIIQVYPGFELSDDQRNWVFQTGSTGELTTIRILMPHETLAKSFGTGDALDQLTEAMKPLTQWSVRGEKSSVQYLEELLPEHRAILEMYKEIIIESL